MRAFQLNCRAKGADSFKSVPALEDNTIMYMPGGVSTLTPSQNGKPVTVCVEVDAGAADALDGGSSSAGTARVEADPRILGRGTPTSSAIRPAERLAIQSLLWTHAGLVRDADRLREALVTLDGWEASGDSVGELETRNLLQLGRLLVIAALTREESRGAHFRTDFPETRDELAVSTSWVEPVSVEVAA